MKNRPLVPDAETFVSLDGLPTSTLPWNCACPEIFTFDASGKFHSSFSRRLLIGSWSARSPV